MPNIRIQDIADILIMTFLLYQLYSWFRRTRAFQVLLGLGVVTLIYFATRFLGLYMTSWVLQELGTVLIILIIVVFQAEIRQALYRFSRLRHFMDERQDTRHSQFQEIAETLFGMAARRTGALLVFQRNETLDELLSNGVRLDSEISPQMLESLFYNGAPFHDGAALIRDGRIALASCHLPLSVSPDIPRHLGTRHRAALGLSERSDAVVVVLSEERGEISLIHSGDLRIMTSPAELIAALEELLKTGAEPQSVTAKQSPVCQHAAKSRPAAGGMPLLGAGDHTTGADHNSHSPGTTARHTGRADPAAHQSGRCKCPDKVALQPDSTSIQTGSYGRD